MRDQRCMTVSGKTPRRISGFCSKARLVKRLLSVLFAIGLVLTTASPTNATPQNVEITHWLNGCKFHYQFGTYLTVPYVWGETQGAGYRCRVYGLRLAYAKGSRTAYKDRQISPSGDNSSVISHKYRLSGPAGWNAYGARICFGAIDRYGEAELQFNVHLTVFEATTVEVSSRSDYCAYGF